MGVQSMAAHTESISLPAFFQGTKSFAKLRNGKICDFLQPDSVVKTGKQTTVSSS
jgi:hypothetical protein